MIYKLFRDNQIIKGEKKYIMAKTILGFVTQNWRWIKLWILGVIVAYYNFGSNKQT